MSASSSKDEDVYFIDLESAAELGRLMEEDRLLTKLLGGLLPERNDTIEGVDDVLDVACGPGGWALNMAFKFPEKRIVGIDVGRSMIGYARAQARVQGLQNVRFIVINSLEAFPFADQSFDLVNARLIRGSLPAAKWLTFLKECYRILRPGGVMRITEAEWPITNSPRFEKLGEIYPSALWRSGTTFSPGGREIALTPVLSKLLKSAGYQQLCQQPFAIDFSFGTEAHDGVFHDLILLAQLLKPYFIAMGTTTNDEIEALYRDMQIEQYSDEFCGIWYFLTVWGERPRE